MGTTAKFLSIAAAAWTVSLVSLTACQVPVFRYALERWISDRYLISVVPGASGELSSEEQEVVDYLKSNQNTLAAAGNTTVQVKEPGENATDAARLELYYPNSGFGGIGQPIWTGALTMANARQLFDSPVRREIVKRILKGESSIWILLESGDPEKDDDAEKILAENLKEASETLKIPEGVVLHSENAHDDQPVNREDILQSEVPLKISFSAIRLRRDDPAESVLVGMLLHLEDDLMQIAGEPMAFPVFGRGRVLEPLVGAGVNRSTILEYAGYLCGACSCEVKDQNPGRDLIIAANWDALMEGHTIVDKILPPPEMVTIDSAEVAENSTGPASIPMRTWALICACILILSAAALFFAKRPSS